MSVDVHALAINFIEANESAQLTAHFRQELLSITPHVALLLEQLHLAYNGKPAKGYASFSSDKVEQMLEPLSQWQQGENRSRILSVGCSYQEPGPYRYPGHRSRWRNCLIHETVQILGLTYCRQTD